MSAIDGMLGGSQTLSLSAATTFTLSAPAGSITPGAGPNQAQNAILKFTGTLTGNAVITLPLPGYYIINNACTVGAFYVQLRAVGTGNLIGVPPGKASKIWTDGTDVGFCDQPDPGVLIDLVAATTPGWYPACSVLPYLLCNGAVYSTSTFPQLGAQLGSTFGGNGVSTFGVPPLQNKFRVSLGSTITTTGGLNGAQFGASGGGQTIQIATSNLPASIPFTDPGHVHTVSGSNTVMKFVGTAGSGSIGAPSNVNAAAGIDSAVTGITISPGSPNTVMGIIPPAIVHGITLIKT